MGLREQQQLNRIRKGDVETFESLFHRFYAGLTHYAESLVRKEEIAEEVVQDVFYNIWKNRDSLRIQRTWKSYLYRAVYNNSMMHLRKTRREFLLEDTTSSDLAGSYADPSESMEYHEISDLVNQTLASLPERTREIFRLNREEGKKYREIAEELSISVKTVEANMGKALKALRTSLENHRQE